MIRTLFLSLVVAAATILPLAGGGALAADYRVGDLVIETPWSRATPPNAPVAGGYMTITNEGDRPDRLVGGDAPFAGRVEIHEMAMDGDVMRMREIEGGLAIGPGETVTLEPGGFHVMFMDLSGSLAEGETVSVTLEFERAGSVTVDLSVAGMGARAPAGEGAE